MKEIIKGIIVIVSSLVLMLSTTGYSNDELPAGGNMELNTTQTEKWLYSSRLQVWDDVFQLELPEFPGITFTGTSMNVMATNQYGETVKLFSGMPIRNVYLADITGNGMPDFVATISMGSGIVDRRVIVYDFYNRERFVLSDRAIFDYELSTDEGVLIVIRTPWMTWMSEEEYEQIGTLAIVDGRLTMIYDESPSSMY